MTPLIDSLYETRKAVSSTGEILDIHSDISPAEGKLLHGVIAEDPSIKHTIEVGCAHGLSSLHICEALRGRDGAHHTIIDPFQNTNYNGLGVHHLNKAGIDFYEWVEEKSEFALPKLAKERPGTFDLAFIDGMHTFDHTLIDAFYSLRLLRVGGVLVIDDCDYFDGIDKVISYLKNYPCLRVHAILEPPPPVTLRNHVRRALGGPIFQSMLPHKMKERFRWRSSMVALKKISEDNRPWDWYAPF